MYLAIKESAYQEIFEEPIGQILLKRKIIKLLVFDPKKESILQLKYTIVLAFHPLEVRHLTEFAVS